MLQTFTFLAGGRQIDAQGTYFRYEAGDAGGADTSIRLRADGNDLGMCLPGDEIELPVTAKRWEVVPTSGNLSGSVRIGLGRITSTRLAGNVTVVDQISASCQVVSAGVALGIAAFAQNNCFAVQPNGFILRSAQINITAGAGGFAQIRMIAAPVAPASFVGTASQYVVADCVSQNGVAAQVSLFDLRKRMPSGWGLYVMTSIQTAAATAGGFLLSAESL